MTLERIASSASRYWVVRPRIELNAESVVIHAITHAQIEAAPDFGAVIDDVLAALAGRVVVVHCRDIERSFLDRALAARIGEGIEFPVIDTMELEARIHRAAPPGFFARLFGKRPAPESIRLADSRTRYRLPRYRAHHAAPMRSPPPSCCRPGWRTGSRRNAAARAVALNRLPCVHVGRACLHRAELRSTRRTAANLQMRDQGRLDVLRMQPGHRRLSVSKTSSSSRSFLESRRGSWIVGG